ncbi:unnamed protein product [Rotaria sp. Silwood2]|nr:unnamed protein product [Rotaria sp. Silwood2]CAF4005230.1 unnamed protein product [Rotaria sp. Silwood2]
MPTVESIREWKYPLICSKDEMIDAIVYNNGNLALVIKNVSEKSMRIELRYAKTFDRIWTLQLAIKCGQKLAFCCCSLTCNEWLIVDYETGRLLQIAIDGKVKKTIQYYSDPYRTFLLDLNMLAVSTMADVKLHAIRSNE